jgi:hypothetical protein
MLTQWSQPLQANRASLQKDNFHAEDLLADRFVSLPTEESVG